MQITFIFSIKAHFIEMRHQSGVITVSSLSNKLNTSKISKKLNLSFSANAFFSRNCQSKNFKLLINFSPGKYHFRCFLILLLLALTFCIRINATRFSVQNVSEWVHVKLKLILNQVVYSLVVTYVVNIFYSV